MSAPPGERKRGPGRASSTDSTAIKYQTSISRFVTLAEARRQRQLQAWFEQHVEPAPPVRPCSYGMSAEQLAEYGRWLKYECGWRDWELRARFPDPSQVTV